MNLPDNFPHLHHYIYLCETYSEDPYIHMSNRWCYCDLTEKDFYCHCQFCKDRRAVWGILKAADGRKT